VQTSPHIRILVVTMFQDDDSVFFSKLQVADRAQAIVKAREAGIN
jgi:hypothetical protein